MEDVPVEEVFEKSDLIGTQVHFYCSLIAEADPLGWLDYKIKSSTVDVIRLHIAYCMLRETVPTTEPCSQPTSEVQLY